MLDDGKPNCEFDAHLKRNGCLDVVNFEWEFTSIPNMSQE